MIIGVVMAFIFIMSGSAIAVDNSAGNNTVAASNSYQPANSNITHGNTSIAAQFSSWYMRSYPGSNPMEMNYMNTSARDAIFSKFVHNDLTAQELLKEKDMKSIIKFNAVDHRNAERALNSIINRHLQSKYRYAGTINYNNSSMAVYSHAGNGSTAMITYINPELPGGVTSDSGEWVMVSINYFVYHAPWYLGGWSVTYGEHDVINSLYGGNSAQNFYNHVSTRTSVKGIVYSILLGALASSLFTGGLSLVAGAIASAAVAIPAYIWVNDLTTLYESTYANHNTGNKYIWIYDTINYYYPWITVAGSFASSIGIYGYTSNSNIVTFVPNVPFVAFGGVAGVVIAADLSTTTHNIANNIGWNNWGYEGSYTG